MAKIAAIPAKTGLGSWSKSAMNNEKTMATPVLKTRAPNFIESYPFISCKIEVFTALTGRMPDELQ
ncbi:hypothetical protein GCM10011384_39510 [Psychrobacillus lasiicapitis]|nr:hypothetical protein GCM10011384_39510 [Psychrobacillus lasiicapitis]